MALPPVGAYPYSGDLLKLQGCISSSNPVPACLLPIVTPLQPVAWAHYLQDHPDQAFVDYLLAGMQFGFRIGFDPASKLRSAKSNIFSAEKHPEVIQKYLDTEGSLGRVLGPFEPSQVPGVHVSRFGVIPKPHQPGKWRLIVDLSRPIGASVNDGIARTLCCLKYMKVDSVADAILDIGRGAELAKIDIKSAHRIVPVHPGDRWLLGMKWQGRVFVDGVLPFGLCSAPKIFTALADGLEWILREQGVAHIWNYLDDYITVGSPRSGECAFNCRLMTHICEQLGVPLAPDKCKGPTTCMTFLGIELDTVALEARLPPGKLERIRELVSEWLSGKACTREELDSLVGQLQHAATVVRPGRTFLRRMYDLLATLKKPHHHVPIRNGLRSDLAWWDTFLQTWNGTGSPCFSHVGKHRCRGDLRRVRKLGMWCPLGTPMVATAMGAGHEGGQPFYSS